jgi:deoxycytidylate deaminase
MDKKEIKYPFLPEGREIRYVPASNEFIKEARAFAREHSLDAAMPNASVLVKDGIIIARAANGSDFHKNNECERIRRNIPTGQGYELCEGCHPKNHSEQSVINEAKDSGFETEGSDIYLWGHWWCCGPCWDEMIKSGIRYVYLLEGSEILFDKNNPDNIVGNQFEATED